MEMSLSLSAAMASECVMLSNLALDLRVHPVKDDF
jgi:hypothetical protein